jgi:hypothetical protein
MNAVNGLIDWVTSPDNGSLKVGMRGSFARDPGMRILQPSDAHEERVVAQ